MDFRFQSFIRKWADENIRNQSYDLISYAGASKDLDAILNQIDLSVRLHHIPRVVLIHHEDCGAYGPEGTFERHAADLLRAKEALRSRHPQLDIDLYYLKLNGEFEPIR